jgi:serine/threonine protein kinase
VPASTAAREPWRATVGAMADASRFGPYALVRRLGRGGMAETFVATRLGPGGFAQEVCVKRILPAHEEDPTFVTQFNDEARVSASLRHANVVSVLDFGVVDGLPYLALELVDGLDLYSLIEWHEERREKLTAGIVIYLAVEIASALEHAHGKTPAVVHRDISPSNVLLSRAGEVKLSDFGIAKVLRSSRKATTTATIKGKVPYMAPEYALEGRFDARCDLFALGVMLYELLAGRRPYEGRTDLETLTMIQAGKYTPLAEAAPGAMPAFVAIVEKLIQPDADARFQSASELLDALVENAPPPTARKILGDLVKKIAPMRRSDPSIPSLATALASGAAPSLPASEPTPAPSGDATRTRAPGNLVTAKTPERTRDTSESDPATTRTALSQDVIDALRPTVPERTSPGADPEVRAAFEASQRTGAIPETRSRARARGTMAFGVVVGIVVLGVIAVVGAALLAR